MNKHIYQVYFLHLNLKAPVTELRAYVAAYGLHDEIEWDWDEGSTLKYEETYRYIPIQKLIDQYIK